MALGMHPRKKGLFGKPFEVPGTPGIGDGMDQMPTGVDPAPGLGMRGEAPEQKMGLGSRLFGQGWEDKAFALGGVIRGDTSGVQMMRQQKQAEQQAIAQQAAKMRERSMDMADWRAKEDYKRENDSTAMQQNYEYLRQIDPEAAESYLKRQTDPIQWITGPDGVPRPYGVGGQAAPTRPVGKLTPISGGSGGNAGGGF